MQRLANVQPGEKVEALGFAALGGFAPYIDDAILRHITNGTLPAPKKTTAEEILVKGTADAELVQMEAQFVQDVPRSARPKFLLQDGNVLFTANLEHPGRAARFPVWKAGSLIRIRQLYLRAAAHWARPRPFIIRRIRISFRPTRLLCQGTFTPLR